MRGSLRVLGKLSAENTVLATVGRNFSLLGGGISFPTSFFLASFPTYCTSPEFDKWMLHYFLRRRRTLWKAHSFLPELIPSTRCQALMLAAQCTAQCMAPQVSDPDGLLSTLGSFAYLLSLVFGILLHWVVVGIKWVTYVEHLAYVWYRVNAEIIIITIITSY